MTMMARSNLHDIDHICMLTALVDLASIIYTIAYKRFWRLTLVPMV